MEQLIRELYAALESADLYLNSYDTSAPSRIKATTRANVEAAIGLARSSVPADVLKPAAVSATTPGLERILGRDRVHNAAGSNVPLPATPTRNRRSRSSRSDNACPGAPWCSDPACPGAPWCAAE